VTKKAHKKSPALTTAQYDQFQRAFDFFNKSLFQSSLPHALITLQRHAKTRGYFSPNRFKGRYAKEHAHEIAMNPDTFLSRKDVEILSTLVHEMVHLWQHVHGKPSKSHHNKEWGAKMKEIGLHPSATGLPGGKETGQKVTHYIVKGGSYEKQFAALLKTKFGKLRWDSLSDSPNAKKKRASKTKFSCPVCDQNAWGKPDCLLICGVCHEADEDEIVVMIPQAPEGEDD